VAGTEEQRFAACPVRNPAGDLQHPAEPGAPKRITSQSAVPRGAPLGYSAVSALILQTGLCGRTTTVFPVPDSYNYFTRGWPNTKWVRRRTSYTAEADRRAGCPTRPVESEGHEEKAPGPRPWAEELQRTDPFPGIRVSGHQTEIVHHDLSRESGVAFVPIRILRNSRVALGQWLNRKFGELDPSRDDRL
jgi:hypothetical protein